MARDLLGAAIVGGSQARGAESGEAVGRDHGAVALAHDDDGGHGGKSRTKPKADFPVGGGAPGGERGCFPRGGGGRAPPGPSWGSGGAPPRAGGFPGAPPGAPPGG